MNNIFFININNINKKYEKIVPKIWRIRFN